MTDYDREAAIEHAASMAIADYVDAIKALRIEVKAQVEARGEKLPDERISAMAVNLLKRIKAVNSDAYKDLLFELRSH